MRVSAWKSFLPTHRRSPMRIVIVIVRFDQDRRLALTGFVITSATCRVIRYPTDQGQTQSQDPPKGLVSLIDAPPVFAVQLTRKPSAFAHQRILGEHLGEFPDLRTSSEISENG